MDLRLMKRTSATMEEHELYSGLIIKKGARYFFLQSKGPLQDGLSLFLEALKSQSLPKHKLALAAVQNIKKRKAENDLQTKEATSSELTIKVVKAVTEVRDVKGPRQGVH